MGKTVIFTGHYYRSRRRASFHFIADELARQGHEVHFVTVNVSLLKRLRKHAMFKQPGFEENIRQGVVEAVPNVYSHILYGSFSIGKFNQPILDWIGYQVFRLYPALFAGRLRELVAAAETIIFESSPGLLFFAKVYALNPAATYIYRVSDDLRALNQHTIVRDYEKQALSRFNLVSVPCTTIYDTLLAVAPDARIKLQPHGLQKELFDQCDDDPYSHDCKNAVFCGTCYLDDKFLDMAAQLFPDMLFHIIGPFSGLRERNNIKMYGEMEFVETVKYIKYADIGLQTRRYMKDLSSLTDSMKVIQYSYCRLPIIAPQSIENDRPNWFTYELAEESVRRAIEAALAFDQQSYDAGWVRSWQEMIGDLLRSAGYDEVKKANG